MTTGTQTPKKTRPSSLRPAPIQILIEQIVRSKAQRIDREKGILYHVKILGLESENGRRYSPEAIREAVALYEGRAVNADHPAKGSDQRSVNDRFGWFEHVIVEPDGLYGDFHLLDLQESLARKLLNAAEQKPDLFGFSHNALGEGDELDGLFVVRRITEVRSVDLVTEPATTKSLYESRNPPVKIKLKALLEKVMPKAPAKQKKALKALLEQDDMALPLDQDVEAPAAEPGEEDWRDHLVNAIKALVASDDPDNHDLAMKILKMIRPEAAADETSVEEEDAKDEEKVEEQDEQKDKEKDTKESVQLKQRIADLERAKAEGETREKARDLCEQLKIMPDKTLIEALVALRDDKKMKALLEREKKLLERKGTWYEQPRSQPPGNSSAPKPRSTVNDEDEYKSFLESVSSAPN